MAKRTVKSKSKKVARQAVEYVLPEEVSVMDATNKKVGKKKSPKTMTIGVLVVLALVILYRFKGVFVVAMVNGQPVSRLSVIQKLEKRGAQNVLDSIVVEKLVEQEAAKQRVSITKDEITAEVASIEDSLKQQGGDLEQALSAQGVTRTELEQQIRIQKLVEKLLADKIVVADDEITKYIADNKASLPADTSDEQLRTDVEDQLKQQKLQQNVQTWLEELRTAAKIQYFVKY